MDDKRFIGGMQKLKALVEKSKAVYVLFCRTDCPGKCSCNGTMEIWDTLADEHKDKDIAFVAVDCSKVIEEFDGLCNLKSCLNVYRFCGSMKPDKFLCLKNIKATVEIIKEEIAEMYNP